MALWDDLFADVVTWTNKPALQAETTIALRQAIRAAHKSGKYWKDLATVQLTGLPADQVQHVDIATNFPQFRQVAYIKYAGTDRWLKPLAVDDLVDEWDNPRTGVYYGIGTDLVLRPEMPTEDYEVCYYKLPIVSPAAQVNTWIGIEHPEVIVLWAASTILALHGEQEIKSRVDQLFVIALQDLQSDNIEIVGR
jgi:hypothetical protein